MLKRFFVFLMAFSLLSTHLAQAMSDEGNDGDDSYYAKNSKAPPLGKDDSLDFQDKAFISITLASLIAALFVVYKYKPN